LAEQMYKAAQPQGAPQGAGPSGGASTDGAGASAGGNGQAKKDEGVIDAEYVDVEDKK
jgi:molecular chaperone DnaK